MIIRILAVGTKMPRWVEEGFIEYTKRLNAYCQMELCEISPEKRTKNTNIPRLIENEGEKILAAIKPNHKVIALDVKGHSWSTEQFSQQLSRWQTDGRHVDFLIGGPDGLSAACLNRAEIKWSLSPLTLPHPLARVVLAEQLYRAFSLLSNHPYHRL